MNIGVDLGLPKYFYIRSYWGILRRNMSKFTILYGTETGNSELLAMEISTAAACKGLDFEYFGMDEINHQEFLKIQNLIVVCSTWGDGEQPVNAEDLYEFVSNLDSDTLRGMNYSVLALGDTAFDLFCEAGIQWDEILEKKGAYRVYPRMDCDVDYSDDAEYWTDGVLNELIPFC